jgi:hypothetical protein
VEYGNVILIFAAVYRGEVGGIECDEWRGKGRAEI